MLLEAAYSDTPGFAQIVVGHYETGKLCIDRQRWFEMPGEYLRLVEFVEANTASDVYYTPSTFSVKERHVDSTKFARLVWADADTCTPDKFRAEPTFVVETSPDRYQCYWLLDADADTTAASELSHRISYAHADEGCDVSSWPANKLMRVPGTTHGKTEDHHVVTIRPPSGLLYSFAELDALYSDIEVPSVIRVDEFERGDLPSPDAVLNGIPGHLMETFTGGNFVPEKRSEARWQFETELFRDGATREFVFAAVKMAAGGRLEKFTSQGRESDLWREVCKAYTSVQGDDLPLEPGGPMVSAPVEVSFLSDAERRWVEDNPTFIEQYVDWVKTCSPQSAETYQRSLAFMVLSCVYGNWAYLKPQFGPMKLNLWFLIVGPTTATRKSTARRLALSLVHRWEKRAGTRIDIGSDATGEALTKTLSDRDGLVSLFHRDEFQGFLKEIYTKNYMSGLADELTNLYDGHVKQVLRNSKDSGNDKRAETVFNMLAMGIEEKISATLTTDNFASGFLPRYLWSVADAPPWVPEDEHVGQDTDDEETTDIGLDLVASGFIMSFERARRKWNSTKPKRLLFDDDAWERWNEWKVESKRFIRGLPNETIMEPARDRMAFSVLKAAGLLAIHDCSSTVSLEHLLPVLRQAEDWFQDMMRMANAIASSDFEAKADEIERMVAQAGGTLSLRKVYGSPKFKGARVGEVDEHIRSLVAQGRLRSRSGSLVTTEEE